MALSKTKLPSLFSGILPEERILTSANDCAEYGKDASKEVSGTASLVLLPSSTGEVEKIIELCHKKKIQLVPSGGRTGYSGGAAAVGNEVVLSLERLRKIKEVDTVSRTLSCEAGATTESVIHAAKEHGLFYPVDLASKGSSQIGGNISTNAGGIRVVRYGTTRDWVLGLSVVTPAHGLINLDSKLLKNQTGPDLKELFIGSEGILGVIVEATLKLTDLPSDTVLSLCGVSSIKDAQLVLAKVRGSGFTVSLAEYFEQNALTLVCDVFNKRPPFPKTHPAYLLIEIEKHGASGDERFFERLESLADDGHVLDCVVSQSSEQYSEILSFRESISEAIRKRHYPHKNDIAVPLGQLGACMERLPLILEEVFPGCEVITFGHIGDGNLHVNVLKPKSLSEEAFKSLIPKGDDALSDLVVSLGGTPSGEHGIGAIKKHYLQKLKSKEELQAIRALKDLFDPHGIMNPGKVL